MRHRFHALCPYFAMFPESFPEQWIEELTRRGDLVLDPFCGRGTTPFTALLLGRRTIAADINDVAYCVTSAKTQSPSRGTLMRRIRELARAYDENKWTRKIKEQPVFFRKCYSKSTLAQLLYLRGALDWKKRRSDRMISALILGSLHGEVKHSQAYLSNQMPRTIATKPAYSVRWWKDKGMKPPERDVFGLLERRVAFRYETPPPEGDAWVFHTDVRKLPLTKKHFPDKPIRCAITSPPYFDVTNFEEDQWLRLWFLGGPTHPTSNRLTGDNRTSFEDRYWTFISDMWRSLGQLLSRTGHVVIRIGAKRISPDRLVTKLHGSAVFSGRKVDLVSHEVSSIKNRQTDRFRPGSQGVRVEVDCHFRFRH